MLHIATKNLRIEWHSRKMFATMTFLTIVIVLIFNFTFVVKKTRTPTPIIASILWIALVMSKTVTLSRTFDRERNDKAIHSLLLTPTPRSAIYLSKLLATMTLMLITKTVLTMLCNVLFSTSLGGTLNNVVLLLTLNTVGFTTVDYMFSATLLRARRRDALLSTMLYPIIVPIVIAKTRSTSQLLDLTPDLENTQFWTQFLITLDILFVTTGL